MQFITKIKTSPIYQPVDSSSIAADLANCYHAEITNIPDDLAPETEILVRLPLNGRSMMETAGRHEEKQGALRGPVDYGTGADRTFDLRSALKASRRLHGEAEGHAILAKRFRLRQIGHQADLGDTWISCLEMEIQTLVSPHASRPTTTIIIIGR